MRIFVAFLPALLSGCLVPEVFGTSASEWYTVGPVRRPTEEVVQLTRDTVARSYRLLPMEPGAARLETDWDVHMSSHWREGFRTKIEVEFERHDSGGVLVRIRSYREINDNARNPAIQEQAKWIAAEVDEKHKDKVSEPALRLRQLLKFKFERS
ncbi:MAG TPA: hypothetical protein VEJ18_22035 [Planctomycetota bacterium]|nr:hypothetical protein [Planctomycetota bacterium]